MDPGSAWYAHGVGTERWVFLVAPDFIACLERDTGHEVVDELWSFAGTGPPTLEALVGAVPAQRPGARGSFAIVVAEGPSGEHGRRAVSAVVRGDVRLDIETAEGRRTLDAGDARPWKLAGYRGVASVEVSAVDTVPERGGDGVSAGARAIASGIVVADRLVWGMHAEIDGDGTVDVEFADDATRPRMSSDLGAPDAEPPRRGAPGPAPAPDVTGSSPAPRFAAVIEGREPILLDGPVVLGRRPSAAGVPGATAPRLVVLPSPKGELSANHLRLAREGGAVVATDLGSTNGTFLELPGRARQRLRPRESLVVLPGAKLHLGDGNIIEIMLADEGLAANAPAGTPVRGPA